jgi:hypothetical protein
MASDPTQNPVQGDHDPPGFSPAAIPPAQDAPLETTAQQPTTQGAHIEVDVRESSLIALEASDMTIDIQRRRFCTRERLR